MFKIVQNIVLKMYSAATSQNLVILNIPFITFLNFLIFILFTYLSSIERFHAGMKLKENLLILFLFIKKMRKTEATKRKALLCT